MITYKKFLEKQMKDPKFRKEYQKATHLETLKKEFKEALRFQHIAQNEDGSLKGADQAIDDALDSALIRAYEAGVKFGEESQRMSAEINNSKIH